MTGTTVAAAVLALTALGGCIPAPELPAGWLLGEVSPTSTLISCEHSTERVEVRITSHLDPTCVYSGGFDIASSDVTLDCGGARVVDLAGDVRVGVAITSPSDSSLSGVSVRNCIIEQFMNNIRVTRQGFKELAPGTEYESGVTDVLVENSTLRNSRGSGVFVDGYVTGVTLRQLEISGSGSVGVYLEAGSMYNVIADSEIHHNGYGDVDPAGVPFLIDGTELRFLGTGREGIAIDGSRHNEIVRNRVHHNSAGGIFLYKNCGEHATTEPGQWWERRYGADDNLIAGNTIRDERNGVWIASRAAENQLLMDCSDAAYIDEPLRRVHRDHAERNTIAYNLFRRVGRGVRVEDDSNSVLANHFVGRDPTHTAVLVGTKHRTDTLALPVSGNVIAFNRCEIDGSRRPYAWVHGHTATSFEHNLADGSAASLASGTQPTIDPFLFVLSFWLA